MKLADAQFRCPRGNSFSRSSGNLEKFLLSSELCQTLKLNLTHKISTVCVHHSHSTAATVE